MSETLSKFEKKLLVTTCFGHFLSHFNMLIFPALIIPLQSQLNLTLSEVLQLSFWMYLLFGITAFPWGIMADKWDVRKLFTIFYLGAGISAIAAGLSSHNPFWFSVALTGIGLFSGIYHPVGLGWISKEVRQISVGMGYNGMFGNLGLASAPLIAGILNWFWGPEVVYLFVGGMNLFGLVVLWLLSDSQQTTINPIENKKPNGGNLPAFIILLFAMMTGGLVYRGASTITPSYFELRGAEITECLSSILDFSFSGNLVSTTITSLIFLIGMLGQYTGGKMASRYSLRYSYLLFHAITIPLAIAISYLSNLPLILAAIVYFFFLLGMQPIENTLVAKYTPPKVRHSAFGFKFVVTFGVGALAIKIIGFMEHQSGISSVFQLLAVFSIILVFIVIFLIFTTTRQTKTIG